jgi:hypothetical protein
MSTKQAKKLRKYARLEARTIFGEGMEAIGTMMRKRPRFVPRFLWILLYLPLFKSKTWKVFYRHI